MQLPSRPLLPPQNIRIRVPLSAAVPALDSERRGKFTPVVPVFIQSLDKRGFDGFLL
jgi:hypothetical protein